MVWWLMSSKKWVKYQQICLTNNQIIIPSRWMIMCWRRGRCYVFQLCIKIELNDMMALLIKLKTIIICWRGGRCYVFQLCIKIELNDIMALLIKLKTIIFCHIGVMISWVIWRPIVDMKNPQMWQYTYMDNTAWVGICVTICRFGWQLLWIRRANKNSHSN